MTNPNIERDKVEEIRERLLKVALTGVVYNDDIHVIADAQSLIDSLTDRLAASEKRAEEPPAELADALIAVHRLTAERDELRTRLDILASQFEIECRERDGAKSLLAASFKQTDQWMQKCEFVESERDEARSSLMRVERIVDAARKLVAGGQLCGENWAALRTALSPHPERETTSNEA